MKSSDSDERAARIASFLDSHQVMSLATSGAHGPHAANVFYARDDFTLVWVSHPDSEHSRHLVGCPRVAATIAANCLDYADIKGLQIHGGACRIDREAERTRARTQLELRFDFLRRIGAGPAALREAYEHVEFYRLVPDRIALIDNSRGFGFKETIELSSVCAERTS